MPLFNEQVKALLSSKLGSSRSLGELSLQPGSTVELLEFPAAPPSFGHVYVTCGRAVENRSEEARALEVLMKFNSEVLVCTRGPEPRVLELFPRLAALAGRTPPFPGSVSFRDRKGAPANWVVESLPEFAAMLSGRALTPVGVRRCVWVTPEEVRACHAHGAPYVAEVLSECDVSPWTEIGRATVERLKDFPPGPAEKDLSELGQRALKAVLDTDWDQVELLRRQYGEADVPLLVRAFDRLQGWQQKCCWVALMQDATHPHLGRVLRSFVAQSVGKPMPYKGVTHSAVAVALAAINGAPESFSRFWEDLPHLRECAKTTAVG